MVVIVIATANTLRPATTASSAPTAATKAASRCPQFAVPELLGSQEGDANVFQDDCETGPNPCPTTRAPRPARSSCRR